MSVKKSVAGLIIVAVFAAVFCVDTIQAAEYNMKFSTYFSPNLAGVFRNMAKNIETLSNGQIKDGIHWW